MHDRHRRAAGCPRQRDCKCVQDAVARVDAGALPPRKKKIRTARESAPRPWARPFPAMRETSPVRRLILVQVARRRDVRGHGGQCSVVEHGPSRCWRHHARHKRIATRGLQQERKQRHGQEVGFEGVCARPHPAAQLLLNRRVSRAASSTTTTFPANAPRMTASLLPSHSNTAVNADTCSSLCCTSAEHHKSSSCAAFARRCMDTHTLTHTHARNPRGWVGGRCHHRHPL